MILYSTNTFLSDEMLELASAGMGTRYLNPVELVLNSIDWSLGDRDLLSIRGRAQFSRTLKKLDKSESLFWEYLNYALAAGGLGVVFIFRQNARKASELDAARSWEYPKHEQDDSNPDSCIIDSSRSGSGARHRYAWWRRWQGRQASFQPI
ncbi:MAG: hypothetical protein R3D26_09895 [Cyanobacteriota/Melainabacteria group bacterium]